MKVWIYPIGFMAIAALSGCSLLDTFFGVGSTPGTPAPVDGVGGLVNTILPGAGALIGLARWGYIEVRKVQIERRHAELVAAGKKDEDNNGEEDQPAIKTL